MLKIPKRGSVRWLTPADLFPDPEVPTEVGADMTAHIEARDEAQRQRKRIEGLAFGVKYMGAAWTAECSFRMQAIRQTELKRLAEIRKGTTAETAPELWNGHTTPEGARELYAAFKEFLGECFFGLRGAEDFKEDDKASGLEATEELGLMNLLANRAIQMQSLKDSEAFC